MIFDNTIIQRDNLPKNLAFLRISMTAINFFWEMHSLLVIIHNVCRKMLELAASADRLLCEALKIAFFDYFFQFYIFLE